RRAMGRPVTITTTTVHRLRLVGAVPAQARPAEAPPDPVAEVCARHADELAGAVESAERAVLAQIQHLGQDDLASALRVAFGLRATLRAVAGSLGELHATLDELTSGHPGAS
ncbi:MAG: hypothetical protein ACRD0H_13815, partial [Actinomycetes bacterium]